MLVGSTMRWVKNRHVDQKAPWVMIIGVDNVDLMVTTFRHGYVVYIRIENFIGQDVEQWI